MKCKECGKEMTHVVRTCLGIPICPYYICGCGVVMSDRDEIEKYYEELNGFKVSVGE